ncbi:hypothetical protein PHYPSEUDO_007193 [Phytophthora pseudosyringae]|uniref:Cyclic nucleotide-binding domain-containing protein n=1 Tax=Phytophthora pseudosyringae TaxID=221518 RepID=A0A8T1VJS0_9STRA|nr:hypothetical protein PHYPSEUDO_007193 [Phytophthora pseudosyringae]
MSSRAVPPLASPKPGSVSGPSVPGDAEALATLKRTLLIAALETPPRFRTDIDVVMIQQHLASLGVFAAVAPQILQYLATECTINVSDRFAASTRIPDGEVLFYQEDAVDDHSHACIILEGSLCGYFNQAFSRRHSRGDNFRSWNSKKTNAKGVTIDFGDLQVTYGKGAICGIDDFYSYPLSSLTRSRQYQKRICRHRSVDTLDRVSERFGFAYEKGVLTSSKESTRTDVSHLVLFSLLSDTARKVLLQTAATQQVKAGEVLFDAGAEKHSSTTAFVIVRSGRLDIHWVECDDTQILASASDSQSNTPTGSSGAASSTKDCLASLTRGQAFGDQMVALGHANVWTSNLRRRRQTDVRFKVVAGDSPTEILWVTRDQYEEFIREDQLRLSYNPIFGLGYVALSTAALMSAIESHDVSQITRQLLTDATLSKFFFQFPPLVLERLCHHMQIHHYESNGILVEAGGPIDSVFIVVTGALHTQQFRGSENDRSTTKNAPARQGSARRMALGQDVHFIPGDAFGARELMKRSFTSEATVFADAGTTVLCIPRSTFGRWASPMRHNTIVKAGSILQPFVWSTSSIAGSPRHSYVNNYASSAKVNRRQSGPSVFSSAVVERDNEKARRFDVAAILLKRLGLFQTLPRFLLAQMLTNATLMSKAAGEELFREGDAQRALVVVLSGFVSFYSLENMSATIDMFQKHPFCIYSTFSGSTTNPEDFVIEPRADKGADFAPSSAMRHRAAMHGVHIQTLSSRNAFRTGVLQEGTVCPATVLAQTDCEYFLLDENMYARLLGEHIPAVYMSDYNVISDPLEKASSVPFDSTEPKPKPSTPTADHRPGTIPPALLSYLEAARFPWLPLSSAKKTLLLRSMQHKFLAPGQRLIQYNETVNQAVLVVTGKLAVYVHESQEMASVLNASQRSVQSAALERSVASNYSTTSQQLYQERSGAVGTVNRRALQRKIARIAEVEASDENSKSHVASSNSCFTDFVLHAAKETKARQSEGSQQAPHAPKTPPSTRRSLHSMVNKVKSKRMDKAGDQSISNAAGGAKDSSKTLFMFHMGPGDVYGEEISAPVGIFRSGHDIYADTTLPGSLGGKETGASRAQVALAGTEVLCLDRHVLHSILAKTEEDAANELLGRASNAKAKWQVASKKLFKRASHSTMEDRGESIRRKKTPKLFDFFKNILNQRRFLTMGTIAHFPLLRDLSDDARRELCLNARFEALDRYTDAYKGNGDGNGSGHRFFLLLTGRISLVANGPNSHIVSQVANPSTADHCLREVVAGEGFGEFEILMPESPAYIAAIAAEPTKLLSIPAEMFRKHWPCTSEARGNIEYLRTRIPSFSLLDLERIAYLYHSFSFQSHVRGTSIFQLHDTKRTSGPVKDMYLIKEGSCCIRQFVTLVSRSDAAFGYDACDGERHTSRNKNSVPHQAKRSTKTIKVLATVADVSAGHVFWMDEEHIPITVVATSAAVTIASISVDKLKAIVPRGMLASLEDLNHQLGELYGQQFELAKRATATVMNENLSLQSQQQEPSQRLPALQLHVAQRSTQSCGAAEASSSSIKARNLNGAVESADHDDDVSSRTERVNAAYNTQHQIEHYDISNELSVSYLVGSFFDRKHARQDTDASEDHITTKSDQHSPKQDETGGPKCIGRLVDAQQNHIKIPVVSHLKHKSKHSGTVQKFTATKPVSAGGRRQSKIGNSGLSANTEEVITTTQNGLPLYEVDVRARVHALMCMVGSPMRAMRLEPSRTPVNSLGKYATDCPSPFAKLGGDYRRQHTLLEPFQAPNSRTNAPKLNPARTPVLHSKLLQTRGPSDTIRRPELTRKQGFLTSLRVKTANPFDGDSRDFLDTVLPRIHQGRRFFYALVDSELREYADTISLIHLAQTPWLRSYNLCNPRRTCRVNDVPVTPGEAEAMLHQSFVLIVDDATQFFLTASSAIDKQKWMAELVQASVLGELQRPVSIKVQSPRPAIGPAPPADPTALAAAAVVIDAFKGRRKSTLKRSSIFVPKPKPDDALQVEYRIS